MPSTTHPRRDGSNPTLNDIADRVGVSIATVSKVINGKPDVSETTRRKVSDAMAALGYRRNRSGDPAESTEIEVVFQAVEDMWAVELLHGILQVANAHGLSVTLTETGHGNIPDNQWVNRLLDHKPAGAILIFSSLTERQSHQLDMCGIPFVVLDPAGSPGSHTRSVQTDNWTGALQGTRHLIALGHRRIAMITGTKTLMCAKARVDGYHAALTEAGIPADPELLREGRFTMASGRDAAGQLLELPEPPTAIFASNDMEAMGVYEAARLAGMRIPEDLSVIGFDDVQPSALMNPPLTTIRQPLTEMGKAAAQMIVDARQAGSRAASLQTILPTSLIVRDSTASPRN